MLLEIANAIEAKSPMLAVLEGDRVDVMDGLRVVATVVDIGGGAFSVTVSRCAANFSGAWSADNIADIILAGLVGHHAKT